MFCLKELILLRLELSYDSRQAHRVTGFSGGQLMAAEKPPMCPCTQASSLELIVSLTMDTSHEESIVGESKRFKSDLPQFL